MRALSSVMHTLHQHQLSLRYCDRRLVLFDNLESDADPSLWYVEIDQNVNYLLNHRRGALPRSGLLLQVLSSLFT